MKFGIITLVSDNYGNKFQNYAVEQILSQYGEVETFGLENLYQIPKRKGVLKLKKLNPVYIREVLISRPMYRYDINRVDNGIIHNLFYAKRNSATLLSLRNQRCEKFRKFAKENLHISDKVLNRENTAEDWVEQYDYFVCGSDQIWNPSYATTCELAFCSFAPEKTICLSPSFGVSQVPAYRKDEFVRWLSPLYRLSVREYAGQKIIKDLTGRCAEVLLDPTMALKVEEWESLCKKPENALPEQYIVCYFLGRIDKSYKRELDNFAQRMDLPVVMLFDITNPDYYTFDPSEVLYTIKNAEYVLTDSFHGTVFSILFHKNFYVLKRNEGSVSMNSRLETLLETFLLQRRTNLDDRNDITDKEWKYVENILETERAHTLKYLKESFDGKSATEKKQELQLPHVYSGYLKDNNKLLKSASGGAVTALAETMIKKGGCVFGAAFNDDFKSVEYICCETLFDLEKIKGSKYCETKKNNQLVVEKLKQGREVLFVGLGCDVAGVIAYCKANNINTDKLYTVDILCHGPVASTVHQLYIEDLENKFNSKIISFTFRSKRDGWSPASLLEVTFEDGNVYEAPFDFTDYGYVFTNYALPRCMKCGFKGTNHQGDICVGDYWGLKPGYSNWNANGVSILIVQNAKGQSMIDMLGDEFCIRKTNSKFALDNNPMYSKSRAAVLDYKKLLESLKKERLHNALKIMPEYRVWKRKMRELKLKSMIVKMIRKRICL